MRYTQKTKLATVILAFGVFLVAKAGFSQGSSTNPQGAKSLADRLDDFSRTVFGGLLPGDKAERPDPQESRAATKKLILQPAPRTSNSLRAGSILSGPANKPSASPPVSSSLDRPARPVRRSPLYESSPGGTAMAPRPSPTTSKIGVTEVSPSAITPEVHGDVVLPTTDPLRLSGLANPIIRPLHERLEDSRRSVFGNSGPAKPPMETAAQGGSTADQPAAGEPTEASHQIPTLAPGETPSADSPTARQPRVIRNPAATSPRIATQPVHPEVTAEADGNATVSDDSPAPAGRLSATVDPLASTQRGVLLAQKGPVLSLRTTGPKRISVGKEAAYQVTIQNSGEVGADEVVVYIQLPEWADVLSAETQAGAIRTPPPGEKVGPLEWGVGHVPAAGSETVLLRIVPRERRPFDLGVRFTYQPVASQAMIEVQEPKLEISLEGPRDVLYGKKEVYRLKLANTGNGDAENVLIKLLPIGGAGNPPVSHRLGTLAAGQSRAIEVELTARQVGNLKIRVEVNGDAGLHAELAEDVFVRRAALNVDVQGPSVQYIGTEAEYRIHVRNPGTATAHNLKFAANIPTGAKYLSGIEGVQISGNGSKLQWTMQSLNAASEQTFVLRCSLGMAGTNRIEVLSAADGDLTAVTEAVTQVEAMADLVLDVKDPAGPIPVGQEAVYEVRVRNRGTKNASKVQVVAYFSHGIEPIKASGAPHRITSGQVIFSPTANVTAGADIVLKIYARAARAGNHVFRAEVHCEPLGTRLVSEESTYFYLDRSATVSAAQQPAMGTPPAQVEPEVAARPLGSADPQPQAAIPYKPASGEPNPAPLGGAQPTPAPPPR